MSNKITVTAMVNADKSIVWDCYTNPKHIIHWNFADPSWHCPHVENNMMIGGKYLARMEARDGSFGFDFEAYYTKIDPGHSYSYGFGDRFCDVTFIDKDGATEIIVSFDPESQNPIEMQQQGWQMILNNFKSYTESL